MRCPPLLNFFLFVFSLSPKPLLIRSASCVCLSSFYRLFIVVPSSLFFDLLLVAHLGARQQQALSFMRVEGERRYINGVLALEGEQGRFATQLER